jgi:hypothetical protein
MTRVLELLDETGEDPVPTGDTATIDPTGRVTYKGDGVRNIISKWLSSRSPDEVFDNMRGWSNGYVSLQEREGQ